MKYYKLFAILILAGMMACSGEKKEKGSEESVETVLPDETNEVTVMKLNTTDFNHELISNGKLSARNFVDLKFESAEPIAKIYVKNGDRVTKRAKAAELSTFRLANKTAQAKDALERAKLELQDVLIGQGYKLEDSTKVPPATMQLVKVKSGYDQALISWQLAKYEQRNAVLTAPFDGVVSYSVRQTVQYGFYLRCFLFHYRYPHIGSRFHSFGKRTAAYQNRRSCRGSSFCLVRCHG